MKLLLIMLIFFSLIYHKPFNQTHYSNDLVYSVSDSPMFYCKESSDIEEIYGLFDVTRDALYETGLLMGRLVEQGRCFYFDSEALFTVGPVLINEYVREVNFLTGKKETGYAFIGDR